MKKHLFIAFILSSVLGSKAQPVLTATNSIPSLGESFTWVANMPASPGGSGPNVTWNFTSLSYLGTANLDVVSPSSIPSNSMFPGANFSYSISSGQYQTLTVTSNTLTRNTNNNGSFLSTYCTIDPEEVLRFPLTYLNSYTDTWKGKWISGCTFTPCIRSGTTNVVADGYGTIILPVGTYSNVLRVTHYVNVIDSIWMGSWSIQTNTTTRYHWYIPGLHHPIAYREGFTHPAASYLGFCYLNGVALGLAEQNSGLRTITVGPNPTSDFVNFYITDNINSAIEICIYDMNGRQILKQEFENSLEHIKIDVKDLQEGLYLATIKSNEVISKRIRLSVSR